MKKIFSIFLLMSLVISAVWAQGKQPYSVLYVGGSSNYDEYAGSSNDIDSVTLAKDKAARTASFQKFLKSRFKTVKVINGQDYDQSMSKDFDVTILDAKPKAIHETFTEVNPDGSTEYYMGEFFTEDFDRPIVCIGEASDRYMNSIGSKNDWFCMCLRYEAHHWNADHQIFKGPWKVHLNTFMAPTYPSAFEYGPLYGYSVPDSILEFVVDGPKFQARKGQRIGVVSRPWGYLDSPETEVIACGVCAKSIDAISIGRHGNIFHWGYVADPDEMTKEAQALFANAVVYMAKRGPEHIIARKVNESIPTRASAIADKYLTSKKAYEESQKSTEQFVQQIAEIQKAAKEKLEKGEDLSQAEKMYVNENLEDIRKINSRTYAQFVKQNAGKAYHYFGFDSEAYKRYYDSNYGYFYAPDRFDYELDVDEDARELGIANNDIKILDAAISLIEQNESAKDLKSRYREDPATANYNLGRRILERYTLCRFETAKEWRDWYEKYKDLMFFTESGGWLWLINTQDRSVPGNDYKILPKYRKILTAAGPDPDKLAKPRRREAPAPAPKPQLAEPTHDQPVSLAASFDPNTKELVLAQSIFNGFHTYAQLGDDDVFILTEVTIALEGGEKVGDLKKPATSPFEGGSQGSAVYQGVGEFRQQVSGHGKATITIKYQACDNSMCYAPETKTFEVSF